MNRKTRVYEVPTAELLLTLRHAETVATDEENEFAKTWWKRRNENRGYSVARSALAKTRALL